MIGELLRVLARIGQGLASRWRALYFRFLGVRIEGKVWLRRIEIPRQHQAIQLGAGCGLDRGVTLLATGDARPGPKISIGARVYLNRNVMIDASESVVIGDDCALGPNCYLTDHDHGFAAGQPPLRQPLTSAPTRLGRGVWLGANVVVLKGVAIGDYAVVGAGSVVTRDIPAGVVAVGVPARVRPVAEGTEGG
jgi:acetyltransferase-like isoleucine patch superfamily enzyme